MWELALIGIGIWGLLNALHDKAKLETPIVVEQEIIIKEKKE